MHPAIILATFVASIICLSVAGSAIMTAILAFIFVACGAHSRQWWQRMARSFKYTKLLLLSIFVFHAVFTPSETYFQLWFLDVSVQGMTQGCYQAFYLLTIIAGVQTLWQFLDRGQMLSGLIVLLFPLTFIGVSIDRLAVRISMILAALQHGLSLPDIQGIREKYATKNPLKLAAYAVVESIDSVKLENAQTEAELRYNATPPNAWEWLVPLATLGLLIWMMRLI